MDNGDMEYCKDREQVFTYEDCVASVMNDIAEGDDAEIGVENYLMSPINLSSSTRFQTNPQ